MYTNKRIICNVLLLCTLVAAVCIAMAVLVTLLRLSEPVQLLTPDECKRSAMRTYNDYLDKYGESDTAWQTADAQLTTDLEVCSGEYKLG